MMGDSVALDQVVSGLRALSDPTRLRLVALCAQADLTVSDMVGILGQSQPRISRHLKVLVSAGILERVPEGAWVFHRLARDGSGAGLALALQDVLPVEDRILGQDREQLVQVRARRSAGAQDYFRRNAAAWDRLRSLHVDEAEVDRAMTTLLPPTTVERLLDVGTGTGRTLALYGPSLERGEGVDLSREMLALARANLDRDGFSNCFVRQGDAYQLPFGDESFDAVTVNQVLHFLDQPERALHDAARVLAPGGKILIVDFAPHDVERLRIDYAHLRLGFADADMRNWLANAGLRAETMQALPGKTLTVCLWLAEKAAAQQTEPSLARLSG